MGTVRRRGGSFQAIADLGKDAVTGKRKFASSSFKIAPGVKAEKRAREWVATMESRAAQGIMADAGAMTVAEYLDDWVSGLRLEVRPTTADWYTSTIRTHILPAIGNIQLRKLTAERMKALYAEVPESSAARVHVVSRRFLSDAVKSDLLMRNPSALIRRPKTQLVREPMWWSSQELSAFLSAAKVDRLFPLWRLLAMTGMRKGEALGLFWNDIDYSARTVTIRRSLGTRGLGPPKTKSSYRTIDVDDLTLTALKEQRKRQVEERLEAGPFWKDIQDYVFRNLEGKPLDPSNVTRIFHAISEQAGLRRIRLHELRDTHGSLLIIDGEHPKVVQERLGHSDISMTLGLYAHVMKSMGRGAADRAAGLVD